MLRRARQYFVDCLFPIYCVQCGREGEWWCPTCRPDNTGTPHFFVTPAPLDGLFTSLFYHHGSPVATLIQQFKYQQGFAMAELWAEILPSKTLAVPAGASVVPVPLYSRRVRERGYNQAVIIGQLLAKKLQLPFAPDLLRRVRATKQQATLSRVERQENMRGAFSARLDVPAPDTVVLVDDVFTTGATMEECARVLKAGGVRQVFGFALARGE